MGLTCKWPQVMPLCPKEAPLAEEPAGEVLSLGAESLAPEPTAPERIGRYELCFKLASGGMASVYLARIHGVSGFQKLVALKRIRRDLAKDPGYFDMFLNEARVASQITHPNVCSVFDFGEFNGEYYIAMEYLMGESVSRLCRRVVTNPQQRRQPLLPLKMARIITDACEGLHAAHELRDPNGDLLHLVHHDVSPRNLFLTYDGGVQVVDFGIASTGQRLARATGTVKGTLGYTAPEQLRADPVDRRADIWALGVTLWEMLAVRRLFRRDTKAKIIHSVLHDEIPPPSSYRPQVPEELDRIVLKALRREPGERWQTAREMGQELRKFLGTKEHIIGPAELSEWMRELFPDGEAQKSQLMDVVRSAATSPQASPEADEAVLDPVTSGMIIAVEDEPPPSKPWLTPRMKIGFAALGAVATAVMISLGFGQTNVGAGTEAPPQIAALAPPIRASEPRKVEPRPPSDLAPQADETMEAPIAKPRLKAPPREPRARSEQPAKPQFGTIKLVTRRRSAEIFEGQKSLGSTPQRLTLPSGPHTLVLKPLGDGKPKTIHLNVEANKKITVLIR